jgi:surface antigen Omp85-like protein
MKFLRIVLGLLVIFGSATSSLAQEKQKMFIDSLDNAFDISHYLYNLHGLLPVVMPITEPAVGYGAAGALLYFIPKKNTKDKFSMPDIVVGAGGYTANGTWFAGGGYIGFWNNDRVRYRGFLGYGDVKLKYYGSEGSPLQNDPANFNISSYFFLQQAITRLGESNFFLGGKYQFTHTNVVAFEDSKFPIDPLDKNLVASGIGLVTEYSKLDNILSPAKGIRLNLTYDQNLELIGSDRNYGRVTFFSHMFFPVNNFWTPAFRIESQLATGSPPFYALPFISLRGVPALRYQGTVTALIETEQQINLTPRWSVVGFAGIGTAFGEVEDTVSNQTAWNAGAGFRYLIARLLGLRMGLDIARGPEDWAVYVVFGYAWMR